MIEMTNGGQWLAMGGTGTPHYVVDPAHIFRLQQEGYQIIADPRITEPEQSSEADQEPEKDETEDDDTTRRLTTVKPTNKASSRRVDTTP